MTKLNIGTIIEADATWSINDIEDDGTTVIITVEKPHTGTYNQNGGIVTPQNYRDDFNTHQPYSCNQGGQRLTKDKISKLTRRVEESGISLQGKCFIVMTIDGFGVNHVNLRRHPTRIKGSNTATATALECTKLGEIIDNGLSIEFRVNVDWPFNQRKSLNSPKIEDQKPLTFG